MAQTDPDGFKNMVSDVPKCILRQKHAFKCFNLSKIIALPLNQV